MEMSKKVIGLFGSDAILAYLEARVAVDVDQLD
jgi:hypothetical protein